MPIAPPALRPGDAVALVAPAGPLASLEELERAIEVVNSLGFVARVARNAAVKHGFLAGTDAQRAQDFNAAANDPEIRGVFALRGGYGTMRILELLDYDALRRDPKVVLGYSDLTALLHAVSARAGIVTFHGPVAGLSQFTPFVVEALRRAICVPQPIGALHAPQAAILRPGRASGRLAGGNLTLLAALEGTPFAVETAGTILVLEDVDEAPYRIDRLLTQLRLSGKLGRAAGLLVGEFRGCDPEGDPPVDPAARLTHVLHERLFDLGVPAIAGASVGHIEEQWTLPIGVRATLDATARTLVVEEAAVA